MVMRRGNKVGGLLSVLKLAPEIIENWLRRACNQAKPALGHSASSSAARSPPNSRPMPVV